MKKIISKGYAKKLVKQGNAIIEGTVTQDNQKYMVITRLDKQTTCHSKI